MQFVDLIKIGILSESFFNKNLNCFDKWSVKSIFKLSLSKIYIGIQIKILAINLIFSLKIKSHAKISIKKNFHFLPNFLNPCKHTSLVSMIICFFFLWENINDGEENARRYFFSWNLLCLDMKFFAIFDKIFFFFFEKKNIMGNVKAKQMKKTNHFRPDLWPNN